MKLFLAYLGGSLGGSRVGEDHEAVVLVAEDLVQAKLLSKKKWKGEGSAHLDYLVEIKMVDGYKVFLEKSDGESQSDLNKEGDWNKLN